MSFDISKFAASMPANRPRTIEAVTEEILDIKQRVAEDFMELGARLNEAKALLPHGEWLPWLTERVQFSERTAQKFMQLAREYEANPKLAADLGSEKAFALLALPKEQRETVLRDGATVDGKTKPAADLTKREIRSLAPEKKQTEVRSTDQLMICGWMPGGTNPGSPCMCAVLLDNGSSIKRAFLRWTGREWWFETIDMAVGVEPWKWLRLPEED